MAEPDEWACALGIFVAVGMPVAQHPRSVDRIIARAVKGGEFPKHAPFGMCCGILIQRYLFNLNSDRRLQTSAIMVQISGSQNCCNIVFLNKGKSISQSLPF